MHGNFFAYIKFGLLGGLLLVAAPVWAGNLTIDIDYSYDTNGFFTANPQAEVLMNDAASFYESVLSANLGAIDPNAASASDNLTDSWVTDTFNPADPSNAADDIEVNNLIIPANTIVIYVGGGTLGGGSELGLGGFGGYGDSGTQTWLDTVQGRGQSGALGSPSTQTTFAPWGGSISFSTAGNWFFDPNLTANNSVPAGEFDFYSVALHELGHVLGIGTSNVWENDTSGGLFDGTNAVAANGGSDIAESPDLGHWAEGTMSDIYGTSTLGNATMTPTLTDGTRNLVTNLDVAGLQDMGWLVIPEPAAWPWAAAMVVGLQILRRKKSVANAS